MVKRQKRKTDIFQGFFTNCNHILHYMITLLEVSDDCTILEPCAGQGAFIDKLLEVNNKQQIDAYDLNIENIDILKKKYSDSNIAIKHLDFLLHENSNKKYDRIIANPPYGAYQAEEKRNYLKRIYPGIFTKETYGIFLIRALGMLKKNGRLVFIIPDTYLNLHMHQGLRLRLLRHYSIESITLFPSNFFPGVNFGYAGLSIISIINRLSTEDYSFPVYRNFQSSMDFYKILDEQESDVRCNTLKYSEILSNPSCAFYLPEAYWISNIFQRKSRNIDDIANVVTGFYSGNDGQYLKRANSITRGAKKYGIVDKTKIFDNTKEVSLDGIQDEKHFIPIVKGGNKRFYKSSEWFMDWSARAVYDYRVTNKKRARFQNSFYYFRQGLAIPMVSSSTITASLIENRLFDQSIVGVFLKEKYSYLLNYLLGFFNSSICNKIIRTINPSTNNSANYIKKIPIIIPSTEILDEINHEVIRLYQLAKKDKIEISELNRLDTMFNVIYENAPSTPSVASTEEGGGSLFAQVL